MIPNIFVSSTIRDLFHLREAIKEAIEELSYNAILSEYGSVGYLPTVTAEQSCYVSVQDCQLVVLIIGKQYGHLSENGFSVTYNEFINARQRKIPVITLVEEEVLVFKRVYDLNEKKVPSKGFPGMDQPTKTFQFVQEIVDSEFNNGILPFRSIIEARDHLKKQVAHLFGELLRSRFDPIKSDVKDVLSEIKALRYELAEGKTDKTLPLLKAIRYLISDHAHAYRSLIEILWGSIESIIPALINAKNFDEFIKNADLKIKIDDNLTFEDAFAVVDAKTGYVSIFGSRRSDESGSTKNAHCIFVVSKLKKEIIMNSAAKEEFDWLHNQFLQYSMGRRTGYQEQIDDKLK